MEPPRRPAIYREVIDALADRVRRRALRSEVPGQSREDWTLDSLPNAWAAKDFLEGLNESDGAMVAALLVGSYYGGIHDTLVVLHEYEIAPFDDGYEADPFHDFVGRLGGWEWPE